MAVDVVGNDFAAYAGLLRQCGNTKALANGKLVHARIMGAGHDRKTYLGNLVVEMYGKCGSAGDAFAAFQGIRKRNVISWTMMIVAFIQNGYCTEALQLYRRMELEGIEPNMFTLASILGACAALGALDVGRGIHSRVRSEGLESHVVVGTSLVDMYSKCGSVDEARCAFDRLQQRDIVAWTAMIAAYTQRGHIKVAVGLLLEMDLEPTQTTIVEIVAACASMKALAEGRAIHARVMTGGGLDSAGGVVASALINMYGKCGCSNDARRVFDTMWEMDAVGWTAMITAYAQHGHIEDAVELFGYMELEGVKPDGIAFLSILHGCSHAGLLNEAQKWFVLMTQHHGIEPTPEHLVCMVDLLGRAGQVEEAEQLLRSLPSQFEAVGWISLLGACAMHQDAERGVRAAKRVMELEPHNKGGAYALVCNMYAGTGRWCDWASLMRRALATRRRKQV